jgi:putative nucleotidyltransferase with HDIG domain
MTLVASPRVTLAAIDGLPAVDVARERLHRCAAGDPDVAELVQVVESDLALALAVLRLANHGPRRGTVASIAEAVRVAGPARLRALAERIGATDPLGAVAADQAAHAFGRHCLAVQTTMDQLAIAIGRQERDELLTAALLHDIGKLVPGFEEVVRQAPPEARVAAEREHLGTDHAVLGAKVARRLGLPDRLVAAIAGHHSATGGCAAMVRLADLLTLYGQGHVIDLGVLVDLSARLGVGRDRLAQLMYELPQATTSVRVVEPCPLSAREIEVLERLAAGDVYKQIGAALGLAASTVRSHLHRIYTRIGVADRTQAVLLARECGWI